METMGPVSIINTWVKILTAHGQSTDGWGPQVIPKHIKAWEGKCGGKGEATRPDILEHDFPLCQLEGLNKPPNHSIFPCPLP